MTSTTTSGPAASGGRPAGRHPQGLQPQGLQRGLKNRHIQLIALGGAIGTGLFYGSGDSISMAGPAILLLYVLAGIVMFFVMRALGEMSVDHPVSGAFSTYAHENVGGFAGFFSGWNYWFNYVAVSMAELVVVGKYVQYWFPGVPTWVSSAVFLVVITAINLGNVRAYGEFEFWFAIVKVVAIVAMIVLGLGMICFGWGLHGHATGVHNLWTHGGFFATGTSGLVKASVVVLFSFGGIELVGITAGEAENPHRSIPRAINQVILRILIFYIGALFVMLALFPWDRLIVDQSPFVSIFKSLGVGSAATILNIVVLTAAVSAYNSGLYSNGRMLHALALQGDAPRVLGRLNRSGSPWVGVLVSSAVTAVAVLLNYLVPGKVFEYVMSVALIAGIFNWMLVMITQWCFRHRLGGGARALDFRMPLFPIANVVVLVVLAGVIVVMATMPSYRIAVEIGPGWIVLLAIAYFVKVRAARSRVDAGTPAARG